MIVAGGTESMSLVPMGGNKIAPNPALVDSYPDVYLTTGLVAENHVRDYGISREEQDAFALRSHQRAVAAIDAGRFADEIVGRRVKPIATGRPADLATVTSTKGRGATRRSRRSAKLRPAFHAKGTVTAGNSSQTSDGAAAVVVMSGERVRELGSDAARHASSASPPPASSRSASASARCPAVRKVLKQTGLTLDQIDLVELNEAFAAQVLACLRELPIDPRAAERQRRRHRARPSARLHRREADGDAALRDAAPRARATAWSRCASAAAWARRESSNERVDATASESGRLDDSSRCQLTR